SELNHRSRLGREQCVYRLRSADGPILFGRFHTVYPLRDIEQGRENQHENTGLGKHHLHEGTVCPAFERGLKPDHGSRFAEQRMQVVDDGGKLAERKVNGKDEEPYLDGFFVNEILKPYLISFRIEQLPIMASGDEDGNRGEQDAKEISGGDEWIDLLDLAEVVQVVMRYAGISDRKGQGNDKEY